MKDNNWLLNKCYDALFTVRKTTNSILNTVIESTTGYLRVNIVNFDSEIGGYLSELYTLPAADPHVKGGLFRIGTALNISQG